MSKILTTLRAVAVVGFVMMSRLKDVSFKELYAHPESPSAPTEQERLALQTIQTMLAQISPELIERIARELTHKEATTVTQEQPTPPLLAPGKEEHEPESPQDEKPEPTAPQEEL